MMSGKAIGTPSCKDQRADARWVIANGHKTQSFTKNGGQQKCLGKALCISPQIVMDGHPSFRCFVYHSYINIQTSKVFSSNARTPNN